MVPVNPNKERYAITLIREKYVRARRTKSTPPNTGPDFLGSLQYIRLSTEK